MQGSSGQPSSRLRPMAVPGSGTGGQGKGVWKAGRKGKKGVLGVLWRRRCEGCGECGAQAVEGGDGLRRCGGGGE